MDYYVYVYIDPRNHEEFYYGKGKGSRQRPGRASKRHRARSVYRALPMRALQGAIRRRTRWQED